MELGNSKISRDSRHTAMAATVMNDNTAAAEMKVPAACPNPDIVEFATCECCGLTEECTQAYIYRVRERYQGRWICGLCSEVVKDEINRSENRQIGTEEALNRHTNFCSKFRSARTRPNPTVNLISAVKQLLFRSLDSPRSAPSAKLIRSKGSFPTFN